jgi:predicted Zn-dependent protease
MQSKGGFGRFLHFCSATTVSFRARYPEKEADVRSRVFCRAAVIALGALALAGCAQTRVSRAPETEPVSEPQEIQMGTQGNLAVLKEYAALNHPALQAYVIEVGQRLAAQSERPDLPWHFTVVDRPGVNAFSLPGGYVYLTRGLLAYLNSEAELAAVIGHEIGHVIARHGVRQQNTLTVVEPDALGSVLAPGMGNQAGTDLTNALAQAWTAGYGRERELEADRLGAMYLAKAGYDPQAMIDVLDALNNQALFSAEQAARNGRPSQATYHGAVAIHPDNDASLRQAVAKANIDHAAHRDEGRNAYLQKLPGLIFGDSPDQGVIRDNALLHEKLGLAIQFPRGWQVRNRPARVVATAPQGDALVELVQGPGNGNPLATLQQGVKLDAGARYDSGHLGGFPAAFAAGTQQGKPVVVAAVLFHGTQYLIAGMSRDTVAYERERSALRAAINSFHAITPAEKRAARPHVLQLLTARSGLTMAALARHSLLGAGAESTLRLMNDLYPGGEPQSGQLLKIVQ